MTQPVGDDITDQAGAVHGSLKVLRVVVAGSDANSPQVGLGQGKVSRGHQMSGIDELGDGRHLHQPIEQHAQPAAVLANGRRSESDTYGIRPSA